MSKEFREAAKEHIQSLWVKRVNPLSGSEEPHYPAAMTDFVEVEIDGEQKWFRIHIRLLPDSIIELAEKV